MELNRLIDRPLIVVHLTFFSLLQGNMVLTWATSHILQLWVRCVTVVGTRSPFLCFRMSFEVPVPGLFTTTVLIYSFCVPGFIRWPFYSRHHVDCCSKAEMRLTGLFKHWLNQAQRQVVISQTFTHFWTELPRTSSALFIGFHPDVLRRSATIKFHFVHQSSTLFI